MHNQWIKKDRKLISVLLIMILIFAITIPTNAMNESNEKENASKSEQISEVTKSITEIDSNSLASQIEKQSTQEESFAKESANQAQESVSAETNIDTQIAVGESKEIATNDETSEIQTYAATTNSKVTFDHNFDKSVLPSNYGLGKNEWQIIRGGYKGAYTAGTDVSSGFDASANVSYSEDNAVRLTKNVVSTDVENEFQMYLNVEPQVSWEEILQLNTIVVSHNNRPLSPPAWPAGGGKSATFSPVKTGQYQTPIKFVYYAKENGKTIILAEIIMYATSNSVPNGGIGIGNPLLSGSGSFYARNNFDLDGSAGTPTAEIDISTLYEKYEFSTKKVQVNNVQDQVNELMKVYQDSFNYDGGSYSLNGSIINWTMPTNDLGLLPYEQNSDGQITPVGVKRTLSNGKITYYRQEAYQMSYKFSLDVQNHNFISATSKESVNDISAEYAVQTNQSPDDFSNTEKGGKVTYTTDGNTRFGDFKSPYIKGLLYNVEFQKIVEGSKIPLSGVTFTIRRESGGNTYSEQIDLEQQEVTGSDGWIKFHNLPWGVYTIEETSLNTTDEFQKNYIEETLPKEIGTVQLGEVINPDDLSADHEEGHEKDLKSDAKNRLFKYESIENVPNKAKITIKKLVNAYDNISNNLKNQKYLIRAMNSGDMDIYLKPESDKTELSTLNSENQLGHLETISYELVVPKNGGKIKLEEIIPAEIKNKMIFESAEVNLNNGSTVPGEVTITNQGCEVSVLPGNDLTITITNTPVGTVKIQKIVDNYSDNLKNDNFIIHAESIEDNGMSVNTEVVLKHKEISGIINIKETTTINIDEIIPKEYSMSQITLSGGGKINGNQVTVNPGENVIVIVHNIYSEKAFFHATDSVKNLFKWK